MLLGTALLHVLPEAFESKVEPHALFGTLLAGLLFFWLLEKAELTDADGHRLGDLETIIAEEDGYVAESDAAALLMGLLPAWRAYRNALSDGLTIRV